MQRLRHRCAGWGQRTQWFHGGSVLNWHPVGAGKTDFGKRLQLHLSSDIFLKAQFPNRMHDLSIAFARHAQGEALSSSNCWNHRRQSSRCLVAIVIRPAVAGMPACDPPDRCRRSRPRPGPLRRDPGDQGSRRRHAGGSEPSLRITRARRASRSRRPRPLRRGRAAP